MQRGLNRMRVKCRERIGRKDLRMVNDAHAIHFGQPLRNLSGRDYVDVAHPATEVVKRSQRVAEFFTAAITGRVERHLADVTTQSFRPLDETLLP